MDEATPNRALYHGEKDCKVSVLIFGKFRLSTSNEFPLPAIITSWLFSISHFITGTSLVACPNPQSNGVTNIFIVVRRLKMLRNKAKLPINSKSF